MLVRGVVLAMVVLVTAGCQPADTDSAATEGDSTPSVVDIQAEDPATDLDPQRFASPDEAVDRFLQALKSGDDTSATSLLTLKAQREMHRTEAAIKPPGSPSAEFEVTEIEYLGKQQSGAHVLSTWTDTDEQGNLQTYEIVWILRKESAGWAIAGMATRVFADEDLLILNFEDPLEAQQKRSAVDREIARRGQQAVQQARHGEPDTIR